MAEPNKPEPPFDHKLWPAFVRFVEGHPGWTFVGQHRDNAIAELWEVFRAGADAENRRMLELF